MIVLIDNYDSFTYNLYQLLVAAAGGSSPVLVVRNDVGTAADVLALQPSHVVLSPGPGHPSAAGISLELARRLTTTPLLGVCLGHQALALALGARVERSTHPRHGTTASIHHDGAGVFGEVPQGFSGALYHSLAVCRDSLPAELSVSGWTSEGDIMAIRHTRQPMVGLQFHPESFMTPIGPLLLKNFLAMR